MRYDELVLVEVLLALDDDVVVELADELDELELESELLLEEEPFEEPASDEDEPERESVR